jgi:hypothetical protein
MLERLFSDFVLLESHETNFIGTGMSEPKSGSSENLRHFDA